MKSPVEITLEVMSGKWKSLILRHLKESPLRFGELKRLLVGVTQKMLVQQLRELEQDRVVGRKEYTDSPRRVEYSLTAYGQTLIPVLEIMNLWGERHANRISTPKRTTRPYNTKMVTTGL